MSNFKTKKIPSLGDETIIFMSECHLFMDLTWGSPEATPDLYNAVSTGFYLLLYLPGLRNPESDPSHLTAPLLPTEEPKCIQLYQYYLSSKHGIPLYLKDYNDNKVSSDILRFCSNIIHDIMLRNYNKPFE